MTGSFSALRADAVEPAEREPHRRAAVLLDDRLIVAYNDVRRFGTWAVLEREERDTYFAKRLGPEPLESGFDASWLSERLAGSRAAIKAALLDQRTVAGVGNIYADEALWRARVHPQRVASSMRAHEVEALVGAVRDALSLGIERQGATLRDYRAPNGTRGEMQDEFAVYGREGEPCERCAAPIARPASLVAVHGSAPSASLEHGGAGVADLVEGLLGRPLDRSRRNIRLHRDPASRRHGGSGRGSGWRPRHARGASLLQPAASVEGVNAVLLTGGSAHGLAAADGVARWLEDQGRGYMTHAGRVPLVSSAWSSTSLLATIRRGRVRPRATRPAPSAARDRTSSIGAGAGCTVGKLLGRDGWCRGGLGFAARSLSDGTAVQGAGGCQRVW